MVLLPKNIAQGEIISKKIIGVSKNQLLAELT